MIRKITLKKFFRGIPVRAQQNAKSYVSKPNKNEFQINISDLIGLLRENIRPIALICAVVMIITAMILMFLPDRYTSTASILPAGGTDRLSTLRELTGLAGYDNSPEANSSRLFPDILYSNVIRDAVLGKEYTFHDGSKDKTMTLNEFFGSNNPDILRIRLSGLTDITTDKKSGIIKLKVETEYPELSQSIASNYLAELDRFNRFQRRSTAGQNVRYLEHEIDTRRTELNIVEDSLETFQLTNRNWDMTSNPVILKTIGRLKRDIEIKSRTYALLQEQYELAKLEAQKDIPIVQILDSPNLPATKSGPFRLRLILISGLTAIFITALIIILTDIYYSSRPRKQINLTAPFRDRRTSLLIEDIDR
nr:hypothetical protein [candidate division Zixibacteria bacterium]